MLLCDVSDQNLSFEEDSIAVVEEAGILTPVEPFLIRKFQVIFEVGQNCVVLQDYVKQEAQV
jgi:hypothetical protein